MEWNDLTHYKELLDPSQLNFEGQVPKKKKKRSGALFSDNVSAQDQLGIEVLATE